jgi:hypothetical protein
MRDNGVNKLYSSKKFPITALARSAGHQVQTNVILLMIFS